MACSDDFFGELSSVREWVSFVGKVGAADNVDTAGATSAFKEVLDFKCLSDNLKASLSHVCGIRGREAGVSLVCALPSAFRSWRTLIPLVLSLSKDSVVAWARATWPADESDFVVTLVELVVRFRDVRAAIGAAYAATEEARSRDTASRNGTAPTAAASATTNPIPNAHPHVATGPQTRDPAIQALMAAVTELKKASSSQQSGFPLMSKDSHPELSWRPGEVLPDGAWRRPAVWANAWQSSGDLRKLTTQAMGDGVRRSHSGGEIGADVRALLVLASLLPRLNDDAVSTGWTFMRVWSPIWAGWMARAYAEDARASGTILRHGFVGRAREALEAVGHTLTEQQVEGVLNRVAKKFTRKQTGIPSKFRHLDDRNPRDPSRSRSRSRATSVGTSASRHSSRASSTTQTRPSGGAAAAAATSGRPSNRPP